MPKKTSQTWPKICASSLQLSDALRTKRLKTCSKPTSTIAAKISATKTSAPRSIAASARVMLIGLLRADLGEQRFGAEFFRELVLRRECRLLQRRGVDVVDLHADLLQRGDRLGLALGRHRANDLGAELRRLREHRLLGGIELAPLGQREDEKGRVHQMSRQRHAARDLVELERQRGRRGVLVAVEHAALQRGVDLAEVHRRR